ncbi:Uncharacterised protein [Mycobacteroides abscessus subsp. abscessus]|nr:Uncharacterised protein [Mycobacteroides abscessus subsp. abscessus]
MKYAPMRERADVRNVSLSPSWAKSSRTSGCFSMSASQLGRSIAAAASSVRSAAGRAKSCSSTEWTSVPLNAACEGGSGSLSMLRNRNFRGHWTKSFARDGERLVSSAMGPL